MARYEVTTDSGVYEVDTLEKPKYGQPSVSSQGLSYVKEHPFKTALQPLAQTLTGKSLQERALEATAPKELPVKQIGRTAIGPTERDFTGQFLKQALAGMAGSAADIATTPASYVPIPGAQLAGKIPVGSTTVRRIAKKVEIPLPFVRNKVGFREGVKELQRMESSLQQSGKLSSRGIYQQDYKPGIENPAFRAFVAAVQPNLRKFKSGKDLQNYKKDVVTSIQTINDYSPALQLKNPETEQITNLPTQSRNIVDFLLNKNAPNNKALLVDALEQTKRKLWQSTSGMSREASSQGVKIDMGKEVTNLLDETIKSPQMNTYRSDLVEEAIRLKEKYALRGEVSPIEVEDDLKYLNQEIGKVWNSKDKNAVDFYLKISQALRKKMDDSIEEFLGKEGWQDGRNKYRALKNIESDVLRSAAKTALKGDSTLGDKLLDTFAGEELVRSIITLNPKILVNATAIESFRILRAHFFNPDIRIQNLFKMVGKSAIGPTTKTRPLNPSQPSRGFPFPGGPAPIRQPVQGPPRLPYTPQAQIPFLGRAPYKPTGYPSGAPPQKPVITPYQEGGPTIQGQPPRQTPQGKPGIVEGQPLTAAEAVKGGMGAEEYVKNKTPKGYVTVYHRTNANPKDISEKGFKSLENTNEIFVSNKIKGQAEGYGKNVIELKVKKTDLILDDEFPSGEKHYALKADLASKYLQNKSQLLSEYEAAKGSARQNPLRNKSGQAFIGGGQESASTPQGEPQFKAGKFAQSDILTFANIREVPGLQQLTKYPSGKWYWHGGGVPKELQGKIFDTKELAQQANKQDITGGTPSAGFGILGPTMATGVGLAAALKATAARGETGESLDPKYKQQIANAENYRDTTGDWAQLEDIALRDLKRIGKLKQNVTLKQVKADPQLYDKVAKLYWDRLDTFGIPDKDKALWWLMPGRYRQTGGDISRLKNPEHRNIMQNRIKNIRGGK